MSVLFGDYKKSAGFTLLEIMVVITIISILAAAGIGVFNEVRQDARDKVRKVTVDQLHLAMVEYADVFGPDVDCPSGIKIDGSSTFDLADVLQGGGLPKSCPDGAAILSFIESYMGEVPADPLGPDNKDYYYYFESGHNCRDKDGVFLSPSPAFIYSVNLENSPSNQTDHCYNPQNGNDGGYLNTTEYGGTIDTSVPYLLRADFIE